MGITASIYLSSSKLLFSFRAILELEAICYSVRVGIIAETPSPEELAALGPNVGWSASSKEVILSILFFSLEIIVCSWTYC